MQSSKGSSSSGIPDYKNRIPISSGFKTRENGFIEIRWTVCRNRDIFAYFDGINVWNTADASESGFDADTIYLAIPTNTTFTISGGGSGATYSVGYSYNCYFVPLLK